MGKPHVFTVTVETERTTGKFVSRDAIADELRTALEDADPGSVYVEESEYDVILYEVEGGD
jgi:hypothetical protein